MSDSDSFTDVINATNVTSDDVVQPFVLSPEATIFGVRVETFSYIMLVVGATAPVVFLSIVAIVMKVCDQRKLAQRRRHAQQARIKRSVWALERREYLKTRRKAGSDVTRAGQHRSDVNQHKPERVRSFYFTPTVTVSRSNPDVYFKQAPAAPQHHSSNTKWRQNKNMQLLQVPTTSQHVGSQQTAAARTGARASTSRAPHASSIKSDEANALASFEKIYKDFDPDLSDVEPLHVTSSHSTRDRRVAGKYEPITGDYGATHSNNFQFVKETSDVRKMADNASDVSRCALNNGGFCAEGVVIDDGFESTRL